ncbi:MAG: radical SAM protein [Phycisphaerae bacterium]|nr:radical SAM protein [Phycisphaerae bacterium]
MFAITTKPDTEQKLEILSADAQYDLACACGSTEDEHRRRGSKGRWVYPVTLANGGRTSLFRTLVSNVCSSDCKYCPLRAQKDVRRCSLEADEIAKTFLDYYNSGQVFGLFLSSSIIGSADNTMERLVSTARILRSRHKFRGFIHLKIVPGASKAAIEEAVSLSSAVSLNIETPGEKNMAKLSARKRYIEDVIEPIKYISELTGKGGKFKGVKQTTQFIVGAAGETDCEIVKYMGGLYDRLGLQRIYFSAYQRGAGDQSLPGEQISPENPADIFTREHRLYQVDFLLRKYGFGADDIGFDNSGKLSLETDPKEQWARRNDWFFPVNVNTAEKWQLLRVPGLGPLTVNRILSRRKYSCLRQIGDLGKTTKLLAKASSYIRF